jgi:hypothetical protein
MIIFEFFHQMAPSYYILVLQDTTFRLPIKWIFSLGVTAEYALAHSTSGAALAVATDFNELRRTQIALRSAVERTAPKNGRRTGT